MAKITVSIVPKLLSRLDTKLADLPLLRAAFIASVLDAELPEVTRELGDRKLSARAAKHIRGSLREFDPKPIPINLDLPDATARLLAEVVKRHNLVRDALLNRVILFLCADRKWLKALQLPTTADRIRSALALSTAPLDAIREVIDDPFYYLRLSLKESNESLYLIGMSELGTRVNSGLACFIDDADVAGTKAHRVRSREEARWAALL